MNRWRSIGFALTLGLTLSACSGMIEFGVSVTEAGSVEIVSRCTDRGFDEIEITSPRHSADDGTQLEDATPVTYLRLDYIGAQGDQPTKVIVDTVVDGFASTVGQPLDINALVRVFADYGDATLIGHSINITLAELTPDLIAVSDTSQAGPAFRTEDRASFMARRSSCASTARTTLGVLGAGLLTLVALSVMVVLVTRKMHRSDLQLQQEDQPAQRRV